MFTRLLKPPSNKSFFLFGPRGTGKTFWVKETFPNAFYLDLLKADLFLKLTREPQLLENLIPPSFKDWIIIDEVQKVPELLNEVHRLIEGKRYKFILTGSSARQLRKKGVNLLAGRALTYDMHPLTAVELGEKFDLNHSLTFGHLPAVFAEENPKSFLEAYVGTYLREEVLQEGIVRNLGAFSRFLEAASFSQASIINMSEVARECSVDRKTAESYFAILEDLLLSYRLPVFTKKAKRRLVAHPKFYYFDVGVYRAIRPSGPLDSPEEAAGASIETLFFQELKAINDYLACDYELYYWRTVTGVEVDFIAYGPKGILAFEVKRTSRFEKGDLRGLEEFGREFPIAKRFLIYGGNQTLHHNDITILPMSHALKNLPSLLMAQEI